MFHFCFYDKNGAFIDKFDASNNLPDQAVRMSVYGPFDRNKSNYKFLTKMIESSPKKLKKITICWLHDDESPEFLAFLVLLCNKTDSLNISDCQLSTNATSCLLAVLITRGGIRHLSFSMADTTMPVNQAKILLRGIASSPCLESLYFRVDSFENEDEAGNYLIEALRRNQSLKDISLSTSEYHGNHSTFLPDIVKASILGPNRKSISICIQDSGRDLPIDVLQDALCRNDCSVEKLNLKGVKISTEGYFLYGSSIQNTSVRSLTVIDASLGTQCAEKISSLFKSLEELNFSQNNIADLSFLDPFLFGEHSQLKSLDVSNNSIDQPNMENFIDKLRKVKGLRNLALWSDDWKYPDKVNALLVDVFRDSTDLEHVDFARDDYAFDLLLDLNRGGRRVFDSTQPFPRELLPRVLERASKTIYYLRSLNDRCEDDDWGSPSCTAVRADVVYWMIQRLAPQL